MPSSAIVPGRRVSTTMSALLTSLRKTSLPFPDLRSSASDRLLRFRRTNGEDSPPSRKGPLARVRSPPSGVSPLTTSAPRSASCMAQKGAAMKLPTSTTRMPSSGPIDIAPPEYRDEAAHHRPCGGLVSPRGKDRSRAETASRWFRHRDLPRGGLYPVQRSMLHAAQHRGGPARPRALG